MAQKVRRWEIYSPVPPPSCQTSKPLDCLDFQQILCLGSNHGIPVVSLFSVFNYYRRITSPFLKWLGDQTLFVASIVDKQGARYAKSSIKMRTILQPGAILEILIAKRAQAAIYI